MSDENELPAESKLTRTKQRWAREGRFLTGKTLRPAEQRLPPGQHLTRDWPTLDLGVTPNISREHWRLDWDRHAARRRCGGGMPRSSRIVLIS